MSRRTAGTKGESRVVWEPSRVTSAIVFVTKRVYAVRASGSDARVRSVVEVLELRAKSSEVSAAGGLDRLCSIGQLELFRDITTIIPSYASWLGEDCHILFSHAPRPRSQC